jgi:outer membrane protein OmpA-like peptidoglycan-associated protein
MRKFAWTLTAIGLIGLVPAVHAETASKEESIGFGAGAAIGGAAGGPIGIVVGAALGATLGNHWHAKDEQIDDLDAANRHAATRIVELGQDIDALSSELSTARTEVDRIERTAHPELVSLLQAGIDLDLLFRTDEHSLLTDTEQRLATLGTRLAAMPNIQIHLDGFADERGDAAYNQQLSEDRVAYVREQLVAAGVDRARISEFAHGEVASEEANDDSFALERRVNLRVFIDNDSSLASN